MPGRTNDTFAHVHTTFYCLPLVPDQIHIRAAVHVGQMKLLYAIRAMRDGSAPLCTRRADNRLGLGLDRSEALLRLEALRIDLVEVLDARRTRREPATLWACIFALGTKSFAIRCLLSDHSAHYP